MIYFIRCSASRLTKIGFATDPWRRLGKIQSDNPNLLELLAIEDGGKERETALHKQFRHCWARGEWFNDDAALRAYIETLPRPLKVRAAKRLGGALGAWLYENRVTLHDFGKIVGSNKASLSCICSGRTIPRKDLMQRVYVATHGAVQPNDFYELPPLPASDQRAAA